MHMTKISWTHTQNEKLSMLMSQLSLFEEENMIFSNLYSTKKCKCKIHHWLNLWTCAWLKSGDSSKYIIRLNHWESCFLTLAIWDQTLQQKRIRSLIWKTFTFVIQANTRLYFVLFILCLHLLIGNVCVLLSKCVANVTHLNTYFLNTIHSSPLVLLNSTTNRQSAGF